MDDPAHVLRDVHGHSPGPDRHQPRDHRALRGVPHRRRRLVQLAVQNDREWRRLCQQVLGQPDSPTTRGS